MMHDALAKPVAPYVYQEFPRVLHGARGETLTVYTEAEKATALENGWSLMPLVNAEGVPYDHGDHDDEETAPVKRGPGRPKKVT